MCNASQTKKNHLKTNNFYRWTKFQEQLLKLNM